MTTVGDIYAFLQELAPLELQLGFDNAGIQLGRLDGGVRRALLALDATSEVAAEAAEAGCELIITHHPLFFTPVKHVTDELTLSLIEGHVALISMHTNLDIAEGGVNDVLIALLGAQAQGGLDADNCGRIGTLPQELALEEFLARCKAALNTRGLRYYDAGRGVNRLAVMGGAGGDAVYAAYEKGCDTYVTADVKYHQFLQAKELGINLIDADHFCTENPVIYALEKKLSAAFPAVEFIISERHAQTVCFF